MLLTDRMVNLLDEARDLAGRSLLLHPEGLSAWRTVRALERRGLLRFQDYGSCENGCGKGNDVPLFAITEAGLDALDAWDERPT